MPDGSSTLVDAARAAMRVGELHRALELLQSVLRQTPEAPEPHYLQGEALFLLRRLDEAMTCHARACARGAEADDVRSRCMSGLIPGDFGWMTHMLRGDFENAWTLSAMARRQAQTHNVPAHQRRLWTGESLAGRDVLVRCHQGLGDSLHFARYVPLLNGIARSVTLAAPGALHDLFTTLPVQVIGTDAPLPAESVEIEMMELAQAFGTTLATVPADVPYLHVDPERVARVRPPVEGSVRIGIAWTAGAWKPERSLPLALFKSLRDRPGVALFSLQRGPAAADWAHFAGDRALGALTSDDIVETAATIMQLDLVISVDTMVAHLAGALGRSVWTLLHFAADWRWLLERTDSPWYPTMRLFRQPAPGAWAAVMQSVEEAIDDYSRSGCFSGCAASKAGTFMHSPNTRMMRG